MSRSTPALLILISCIGLSSCNVGISPVETYPTVLTPNQETLNELRVSSVTFPNLIPQDKLQAGANERSEELVQEFQWRGVAVHQEGSTHPAYQRLMRLFNKVAAVTHLANTNFDVILIDDSTFNAYTLGGLEVIFHRRIVDSLTDDELAFIIAHEIAHIALNHVAQTISRDITNLDKPGEVRRYGDFFSISNEQDADRLALVYVNLAGFDGLAAGDIFDQISKDKQTDKYDLFEATHPQPKDRADKLRQLARYFESQAGAYPKHNLLSCNPLYCNK